MRLNRQHYSMPLTLGLPGFVWVTPQGSPLAIRTTLPCGRELTSGILPVLAPTASRPDLLNRCIDQFRDDGDRLQLYRIQDSPQMRLDYSPNLDYRLQTAP